MTTSLQRIQTIRANAEERISELTESLNPTYVVEGREVKVGEYLKQLSDIVAWCDEQEAAQNPVEVMTQGYT